MPASSDGDHWVSGGVRLHHQALGSYTSRVLTSDKKRVDRFEYIIKNVVYWIEKFG
jgi:hypothetical protein